MVVVYGFNEFGQLNNLSSCTDLAVKSNVETNRKTIDSLKNIFGLKFSWNYCVNNSGDDFYISGFVGSENNCRRKLIVPGHDRILQVTCSRKHCLVVTVRGQCWKFTLLNGQWTNLTPLLFTEDDSNSNITHVSCGETVNIAVTSSGWIYNIPSRISFLPEVTVKDVICGKEHSVLLSTLGQVFTWGTGSRGQLGHADLEQEEEPRLIQVFEHLKVAKIAAGGWHTWALTEESELYSWGWNVHGQLGIPVSKCKVQSKPKAVDWRTQTGLNADIKVTNISCGFRHTVILLNNGVVYGCGWNNYGQLLLSRTETYIDTITKLPLPDGVQCCDIECGAWNTAILTKNNTL